MKLPIYDITFDSENPDDLMLCNSLVDMPAVEVDFMAFKQQSIEDKGKLFTFEKDELEHKIFGCVIRCDYPIYRLDSFGREYFVRFSKETIEQIVLKYSKDNNFNLVSLNHDGNLVEGVTLIEWFIKDTEKNINPKGFEHIENGSLFCTYKIQNPDVWEKIQNGEIKGFSIEICCDITPTNESIELSKQESEQPEEEDINSFINDLYEYLISNGIDDVEILFADSKKKIIEEAIDSDKKVSIGLKGKSKTVQGFIYTTSDTAISVYDEYKDEWHIIGKNNIDKIRILDSKIVVNWDKAFAHKDFPKIVEAIKSNPINQPKAPVHEDVILEAINSKDVMMITYFDESGESCTTYREGYILTKIRNRKGNECIRYFETNGATHSSENQPLPSWRTLRLDRIGQIKKAPNIFKPLLYPPDGWNPTMSVERDGSIVLAKSVF